MHPFEICCMDNDCHAILTMIRHTSIPDWIHYKRYKATPLFFVFKLMEMKSIQFILPHLLQYGCLVNLCYDSTDFQLNALTYLLDRKPSLELVRLMKEYGAESIL